jgi:hypothetical protein
MQCAEAAALIFSQKKWRWTQLNSIPNKYEIMDFLAKLETASLQNNRLAESGHLAVKKTESGFNYFIGE